MNGDANSVFVDTNVLVNASIGNAPHHAAAVEAILGFTKTGSQMWISRQVLREYIATLSRPQTFGGPTPVGKLVVEIKAFEQRFNIAEDNADVTRRLLDLLARIKVGGKHVHDANIVATMLVYGIRRLLTHNTSDFSRFSQFITVVPLT